MKNILLSLLFAIALTTTFPAQAKCPSNDADFCSQYALANQGDADAQFNLGVMCWNGEGVITDEREARISGIPLPKQTAMKERRLICVKTIGA